MVYRLYVEKKEGFDHEARALLSDCRELLELTNVEHIRVLNRYDVEDIDEANGAFPPSFPSRRWTRPPRM